MNTDGKNEIPKNRLDLAGTPNRPALFDSFLSVFIRVYPWLIFLVGDFYLFGISRTKTFLNCNGAR